MNLQFLKGMSERERVQALEKVVSGEMALSVIADSYCCLFPWSAFEKVTASCLPLTTYEVEWDLHQFSDFGAECIWLSGEGPDFSTYLTKEAKAIKVLDGKNAAMALIANGIFPDEYSLANEKNEVCHAVDFSLGKRRSDGVSVIGVKIVTWQITQLAVAPATYCEKVNNFEIDTPEFAAVIEVWNKYWAEGKGGMTQDAIIAELRERGFPRVRAEAIEMICRPVNERSGGRKKSK